MDGLCFTILYLNISSKFNLGLPRTSILKNGTFMYSYVKTFIQHQADKGLSLILFGVSSSHASEIQFCNSVAVDSFL